MAFTMVIEVEYMREETTTFTWVNPDEFTDRRNTSARSCRSNARDTSTSPRDALEELRQSHVSILNLTSDAEDSDVDCDDASQSSCLFADLNEPPRLEEDAFHDAQKPIAACCRKENSSKNITTDWLEVNDKPSKNIITDWLDPSNCSIQNVSESFSESLCPGLMPDEPACGNFEKYVTSGGENSLQQQMERDIFALLGCSDQATDDELEAWVSPLLCLDGNEKPKSSVSQVSSIQSRVNRVHRFRKERQTKAPDPLKKTKSFDNSMLNETNVSTETSFHDAIGSFLSLDDDVLSCNGLEPISPSDQDGYDGYDSDPGKMSFRREEEDEEHQKRISEDTLNVSAISQDAEAGYSTPELIIAVQESLSHTWTLTWHPTKENMIALGCHDGKKTCFEPMCIQLWFERGHILHFGHTIIEPQFMWRSFLTQQNGMTMPHQMRLLNVCRALPIDAVDRTKHPLARASHSFMLRMISGAEFVFEAASESERDLILQRWKLVVARLATLAVFEDLNAMQNEFFSPVLDPTELSYMHT